MNETKKKKTYHFVITALMAAILCILCPIAIPIGPVPVSLATLLIALSLFLFGMKRGTAGVFIYLLLGAVGLPVFSGFSGGLQKLVGPTGGYLVGYVFFCLIAGYLMEKTNYHTAWSMVGLFLGLAVTYAFGTAWFMFETKCTLPYALSVCVLPFIPLDVGKIIVATVLGKSIRGALLRNHLI